MSFLGLCEGGVRDPLLSVETGRFDRYREREVKDDTMAGGSKSRVDSNTVETSLDKPSSAAVVSYD